MTEPQQGFRSFNLHARVCQGVHNAGYTTPTPIQQEAIPPALAGRDLLGLAQTGTGKTAAFILPLLHRLMDSPRGCVRALVVAPTRELAEQIHGEIRSLGCATGLRSATVYGGVGMAPQAQALRGRAEIIVACPGRLLDHLESGTGTLASLEVLVLDEADHMFDMGFLPAVRKLVGRAPKGAQRLLFSATMPLERRRLAAAMLREPVTVEISHAETAKTVAHALYLEAPVAAAPSGGGQVARSRTSPGRGRRDSSGAARAGRSRAHRPARQGRRQAQGSRRPAPKSRSRSLPIQQGPALRRLCRRLEP